MIKDTLSIRINFRRHFFASILGAVAWLVAPIAGAQSIEDVTLNVYKSETCGCCEGWIDHMDENGFTSTIHHPDNLGAVKAELGLKPEWVSCHTAVAKAGDPVKMAGAFADAIEAGRSAYLSGIIAPQEKAAASTPLLDKPFWHQEN